MSITREPVRENGPNRDSASGGVGRLVTGCSSTAPREGQRESESGSSELCFGVCECPVRICFGILWRGGFGLPVPGSIFRESCFLGGWRACGCVGVDGGAMEASSLCRALLLARQALVPHLVRSSAMGTAAWRRSTNESMTRARYSVCGKLSRALGDVNTSSWTLCTVCSGSSQ